MPHAQYIDNPEVRTTCVQYGLTTFDPRGSFHPATQNQHTTHCSDQHKSKGAIRQSRAHHPPQTYSWPRKMATAAHRRFWNIGTLISNLSEQEWRREAATAVTNGFFYVCGGLSVNGRPSSNLACFDPLPGVWQALPPMSQARSAHSAAVLGARLYACGGYATNSGLLNSAEFFNAESNSWTPLPTSCTCWGWSGSDQEPRVRGRWHLGFSSFLFGETSSHRKLADAASNERSQSTEL